MDRRQFLKSASAGAIVAALPASALAVVPVFHAPAAPLLPAFAVGTPGEYDWISVVAENAEAAWDIWCNEQSYPADARVFDPHYVTRVEAWDGLKPGSIKPADWLRADLGHCCERCGYETHRDSGARVINNEVVCEDCMTFADRVIDDPEDAVDELANRVADEGEAEVREQLIADGDWELVADLWPRAMAAACEGAAA